MIRLGTFKLTLVKDPAIITTIKPEEYPRAFIPGGTGRGGIREKICRKTYLLNKNMKGQRPSISML